MTEPNEDPYEHWEDNKDVYPPVGEIATALQDRGVPKVSKRKSGDVTIHKCTLIEKLAGVLYNNIKKHCKDNGLPVNSTRGKKSLVINIMHQRKLVDVSEVDTFFLPYSADGKQVFVIKNDKNNCGLDQPIRTFQDSHRAEQEKQNTARTNNDGLRLACIMLDPKHRGSVSSILSNRKTKTQSDVPGETTLHFFEKILEEAFMNADYVVDVPPSKCYDYFPEEEKGSWDPNDPRIFEKERDGQWLLGTWKDYLRKKYKPALDRWNKKTGNGKGDPLNFLTHANNDRWLLWVFCLDYEANFLLAYSTAGRMPEGLQVEAGFESESMSDLSNSMSAARTELQSAAAEKEKIGETLNVIKGYIAMKKEETEEGGASNVAVSGSDAAVEQVQKYSTMLTDDRVLNSMTPDSREIYKKKLIKKRRLVLHSMSSDEE